VIGPTTTEVSRRVEEPFDPAPQPGLSPAATSGPQPIPLVAAGNIAGVPAITVPNGFGQNGIPTGLQFIGAAWSDANVIALADAYQKQTDWHKRRPPAAKL
jgi:aspartyl-tRNA(Asn)/glutamyl-tRNA(Gln) amidotransferase subunit A